LAAAEAVDLRSGMDEGAETKMELPMTSVNLAPEHFHFQSFDPATKQLAAMALRSASRSLDIDRSNRAPADRDADQTLDVLAFKIAALAQDGEQDWRRMRARALHDLAKENSSSPNGG
jgi:hypothetical protein